MQSQSQRATTAAEARFRIDRPNSQGRNVKVIALDENGRSLLTALAEGPWQHAAFFASLDDMPAPPSGGAQMLSWLSDLAGRTKNLLDEMESADLVVMICAAGSLAPSAWLIADAAAARHVTCICLVLQGERTSDEEISRTLRHARPFASMLVIARGEDYVGAMLTALRA